MIFISIIMLSTVKHTKKSLVCANRQVSAHLLYKAGLREGVLRQRWSRAWPRPEGRCAGGGGGADLPLTSVSASWRRPQKELTNHT